MKHAIHHHFLQALALPLVPRLLARDAPPGYVRPKVYTEPKGVDPRAQRITSNILDRIKQSPHVS